MIGLQNQLGTILKMEVVKLVKHVIILNNFLRIVINIYIAYIELLIFIHLIGLFHNKVGLHSDVLSHMDNLLL